ncbi:hypothetical protein [Lentzea aerocolonigenes]|uniref:hypothetical protein n=1 Tax=Lentzea aerocolonigenes TaxID=68170 RepID=UPI0009DEDB00|nr:hypothetical protein [Lentzea aerocolonigenes]
MGGLMEINPAAHYENVIFSRRTTEFMRREAILAPDGSSADLLAGLIARLAGAEQALGEAAHDADDALTDFYDFTRRGLCTLGSPLLTNIAAGRQALGSCSAVPLKVRSLVAADLDLAEAYYNLNMGSGYDLSDAEDPCALLQRLNQHAARVQNSGSCERYVGNIAHISVHHPQVLDFIAVKTGRDDLVHFNISVDVTDDFTAALAAGSSIRMTDGSRRGAQEIWDALVACAWSCGDPGLISLKRYNAGNALSEVAPYVTTAPCAEVGLSPGETCVFGYVNVAACLSAGPNPKVNLDLVGKVAACLTRMLDDAVEASVKALPVPASAAVMASKRKIGIGLCGLADALLWMGLDYASPESLQVVADVLATINFCSKEASLRLARRRGPFARFDDSRYRHDPGFLARFGEIPTVIDQVAWHRLASHAARAGLRNVMTTALPPSGRSALLLGVNPSIEPFLTLHDGADWVLPLRVMIGANLVRADECWGSLFRTATEISSDEHLNLLRIAVRLVDDGVSKTINLPQSATLEDVCHIFRQAWDAGLKAISVYRAGSRGILAA